MGTVLEGGSPAYVEALNDVVIAVMVEKRECVEDLDATGRLYQLSVAASG